MLNQTWPSEQAIALENLGQASEESNQHIILTLIFPCFQRDKTFATRHCVHFSPHSVIFSASSTRSFVFKKTPVPSPSKPQVYLLFHSAVRQAVQNLLHPPILHSPLFSYAVVPPLWGQADTVQRQTLKCLLWKLHTALCTCIDLKLCRPWVQVPGSTEATVTQKNSQQHLWLDSFSFRPKLQ